MSVQRSALSCPGEHGARVSKTDGVAHGDFSQKDWVLPSNQVGPAGVTQQRGHGQNTDLECGTSVSQLTAEPGQGSHT